MRNDKMSDDGLDAVMTDLGAATELTQGTFMPRATESVLIKDYFDQP